MESESQTCSLSGARIHFQQWGSAGPRVLLLHPIGFDHHTWEPVAALLQDEYQLTAIDLPGHGESDKPAGADYSLPSLAARVLEFLREIEWEDAVFVGNSIGGGVSLAAAIAAPASVRALVLLNSVGFDRGMPTILGRLAHVPFVPTLSGYTPDLLMGWGLRFARSGRSRASDDLRRRCMTYFRAPEGRAAFYRTLQQLYGPTLGEMSPSYSAIRCPTLVMHGVHDPLIPLAHAEKLAAAIPGAQLIQLSRCGHFPQEEHPETVAKLLLDFLPSVRRNG